MATLAGNSIASSYTSLLKLDGNTDSTAAGNGSNAIQVKTGDNDATPLFLNTDRLGIGGQPSEVLDVTGNIRTSTQLKLDPTIGSGSVTTLAFMRSGADKWRFIQPHDDSYLKLFNDGASATQMYFASNNNVGIGGTPSNQLTIVGDNAVKNIHIYTNSDSAVTSDTGARIFTTGDGGSGIYGENGHLVIQGRPAGRDIIFLTNSDASEKMRLTSGGNVGIGHDLSSHAQRLVVKKNASATTLTAGAMLNLVNEQGAGNTASIRFSGSQQNAFLGFFDGSSTATQRIAIGVGAGGTGDGHFNVTGDGKVGIGTDSPEEKIHSTGAIVSTGVNDTGATAGTERAFIDLVSNKARIGHFRGTTSAGSGGLQLYTDSVERARINASGLLNLGNSPSVSKNSHVGSTANGITISGSVAPTLSLWDSDDANNAGHFFQIGTKTSLWSYNGDLEFLTGTSATVRMKLDANSRISLSNNDSGTSNTVFGYQAGNQIDSGDNFNVFIGHQVADADMTNATQNVGIGYQALSSLTTGDSNTAVGSGSLHSLNTGNFNVAIGHLAGDAINSAQYNTAVGYQSLSANCGDSNTCIGYNSGVVLTGSANVSIGTDAGNGITSGTNNVVIGKGADTSAVDSTNQIAIGQGATGVADNSVVLGNSSVSNFYLAPGNTSGQTINFNDAGTGGFIQYDHGDDQMKLASNNTIAMRIFDSVILIGRSSAGSTGNGHSIRTADSAIFSRDSAGETMQICRNASDGQFIQFRSDGTIVGDIKNTGGTVSLTGFSGCHESSSSDTLEVGTVVSTIDEEHSENHAKVKISNSVGDKRVYGVVSDLKGLNGNNVTIASVGISSIKVTGSCEGGDLLESNGDGTAKVQSDDIIRSKTIGKVTMSNSTEEVKLVSCVLYCG
jgi:hypothetical protein